MIGKKYALTSGVPTEMHFAETGPIIGLAKCISVGTPLKTLKTSFSRLAR